MESPIRVVVADDHPLVRAGLRLFVESDRGMVVVAEADSKESVIAAVLRNRPDVVLLDCQLPDGSGAELIRSVKRACSGVPILALTTFPDEVYAQALLNAGADGCSSKCATREELLRALRAIATLTGRKDAWPSLPASTAADQEADEQPPVLSPEPPRTGRRRSIAALTPREVDVLRLAGHGYSNRAIGMRLGISSRTVQGYLTNAYHRLRARSRTEAVARAVKLGWFSVEQEQQ